MQRNLKEFEKNVFDLLIVGGGIYGACSAWEAASRGLKVALIEKADFGHASSANHLKMVHGGIRYLQHADITRIRESSHERSAMLRIAPHLVEPLPIIIPTYGHGMKGKEVLGVGMAAYDALTFDRNRGIPDPQRQVPRGSFLSVKQVIDVLPGIDRKGLTGAAVFHDGQMYSPPRLTISFIRSAIQADAVAANYVGLEKIITKEGRVVGAEVRDTLDGTIINIGCKNILLTSGGWTQQLLKDAADIAIEPGPAFSRDLAFVVNRPLVEKYGFACPLKTKDADAVLDRGGRHLFVAPWRGKSLVGVWHGIFRKSPDEVSTSEQELAGYLAEVNAAYPDFNLSLDDITMVLTGLTLFGEEGDQADGEMSFGKRSLLIDHTEKHQLQGLVSLIGVRATTARGMAEKAIDLFFKKLGRRNQPTVSAQTPIFGGDFNNLGQLQNQFESNCPNQLDENVGYALLRNYGTEYKRVLGYCQTEPSLMTRIGSSTTLGAEVVHAINEEMAMKLSDVVFRRTDLGTLGLIDEDQIVFCATIMARELDWDETRVKEEIAQVIDHAKRRGFVSDNTDAGLV